jgi:hypothetical protein
MPNVVTFSESPQILPYFERHYQSTTAAWVAPRFFHEYRSRYKNIERALQTAEREEGELVPPPAAISGIVRVIAKSKAALNEPDVSVFHGEAIVTWKNDGREISLLSRGADDDPKLLRYEGGGSEPTKHKICSHAMAKDLNEAIDWLYE